MLHPDMIEDRDRGRFGVYPVETITQGIEVDWCSCCERDPDRTSQMARSTPGSRPRSGLPQHQVLRHR